MSKDCPEPRVIRCRNCEEEGHLSRECPKPKDWSKASTFEDIQANQMLIVNR